MDVFSLWDSILGYVKKNNPSFFSMFSTQILPISLTEDMLIIAVTKPYLSIWLKQIYWIQLNNIINEKLGHSVQIDIQMVPVSSSSSSSPSEEIQISSPQEKLSAVHKPTESIIPNPPDFSKLIPKKPEEVSLPTIDAIINQTKSSPQDKNKNKEENEKNDSLMYREFTFDNFVYGNCNQFAYESALAAAKNLSEGPNPVFIYGPSGLGKSHLLHAINNYVNIHFPSLNVLFVTSETFTNDLITSIRGQKTEKFRQRYRTVDYLLIDDVQFFGVGNKEATKIEIFNTFNDLFSNKKHIIMTSDRTPNDIEELEERLRSRFGSGLVVPITKPDFEICCAILQKKAEKKNINLPDDVIKYISYNINTNIRELEGAFNNVISFAKIRNIPITLDFAKDVLKDKIPLEQSKEITADKILDEVCHYFSIKKDKLIGKSRPKNIVIPRQIAMYLCRRELDESYPSLAELFNKKDHTTIIYACDKVEELIKVDEKTRHAIEDIIKAVKKL